MKIFFDTEFTGLHKNTTLISLGMIAEDGRKFYAEFLGYDKNQCDDWIKENVIANLKYNHIETNTNWCEVDDSRYENVNCVGYTYFVKEKLEKWLEPYNYVELVSDCCHYDMVLFIDIFGGALDLPKKIVPVCYDINQDIAKYYHLNQAEAFDMNRELIWDRLVAERLPDADIHIPKDRKHNALFDAGVIKDIYDMMKSLAK